MSATITVGTAPDSWGVWFPDDPRQVGYTQFLDDVAAAGYEWIELGPYGFLPTDPTHLRDELDARGLKLSAGTVGENLHLPGTWDAVWAEASAVAALTAAAGGKHLVVLPAMYRDLQTGAPTEPDTLTSEQWDSLTSGVDRLGKALREEYGLALQFHPHADAHVATERHITRLLEATDPTYVNLCLDTGHIAHVGSDNLAIIEAHPSRIGYLHLKQVDPQVMQQVRAQDMSFADAVIAGAMVEPPRGVPDFPSVLEAVAHLGTDVFAIVEQDMYPCAPDAPLPIARRTSAYLGSCGVGAVRGLRAVHASA